MSIVKYGVLCLPIFLYGFTGTVCCAIVGLAHDIVLAYWSVAVSPQLGPWITGLVLMIMTVPIVLAPIIAIGSALIGTTLGAFFFIAVELFEQLTRYRSACNNCFKTDVFFIETDILHEFWKWSAERRREKYADLRTANGRYFDIRIDQMLMGLVLAILGITINSVVAVACLAVKIFPATIRALYHIVKLWLESTPEMMLGCFCPFLVAFVVAIPGVPAACCITCVGAALWGTKAAVVMYSRDSFTDGFLQLLKNMYEIDAFSSSMAFGHVFSIFTCFEFPHLEAASMDPPMRDPISDLIRHPDPQPNFDPNALANLQLLAPAAAGPNDVVLGVMPVDAKEAAAVEPKLGDNNRILTEMEFWRLFVGRMALEGAEVISNGTCPAQLVIEQDPCIITGLPALVIFCSVKHSADILGVRLSSEIILTQANSPPGPIRDIVYQSLIHIKQQFALLKLNPGELEFLERFLCVGADENQSKLIPIPPTFTADPQQSRELPIKKFVALVNGLAIKITQMPLFQSLFGAALDRIGRS